MNRFLSLTRIGLLSNQYLKIDTSN